MLLSSYHFGAQTMGQALCEGLPVLYLLYSSRECLLHFRDKEIGS